MDRSVSGAFNRGGGHDARAAGADRNTASPAVSPADLRWNLLRSLVDCKLCRSITFSVFVSILAIESIILVPSAVGFYRDEFRRLEDKATATITAALAADRGALSREQLQPRLARLLRDTEIVGLSVRQRDGSILARAGDAGFDDFDIDAVLRDSHQVARRRVSNGRCYDIAWSQNIDGASLILLARMDSSAVNSALLAFVLRIAGLVALIVGVVTTATMLVLYHSVLHPILGLRRSMLGAAQNPDQADTFQLDRRPRDELGDVFTAHNDMLVRITESKRADRLRAEERARFLARHDTLTGLPNREFFVELLGQALQPHGARRHGVAVLVLNLAGFRAVNDALGHPAGDRVLVEVARRLGADLPGGRFVARLGADEFGVVQCGLGDAPAVAQLAEELLGRLTQPMRIEDEEIRLKGRIGIADTVADGADAKALLHDAEIALTQIRNDSQASYQFFSPIMSDKARQRQKTERELRAALERGEFRLFYQPKVSLAPGAEGMKGCEALIRWLHPSRGWIFPAEFIPVAEATGLVIGIGEWALREACAQIRRWRDAGFAPPRIAVNLSGQQFHDPGLPQIVKAAIAAHGTGPGLLELEITESVAMNDVEQTVSILSALRQVGVQLAIDDFGTGYSSLSYLRKFEIDSIKIDKSFVDDIGIDPNVSAICDAIIGLGHSLGKRIVAEGVETEMQAEFLRARQCEEAQGFLFGRPMPASEFAGRLIRARVREASRARGLERAKVIARTTTTTER